MAQLINRVSPTGRTLFPARTTSAKSILTMMGYIMKNKQIAIGIETTGASPTYKESPSRKVAIPGTTLPRPMPAAMHNRTQTVR